jgi:hypothetical protein
LGGSSLTSTRVNFVSPYPDAWDDDGCRPRHGSDLDTCSDQGTSFVMVNGKPGDHRLTDVLMHGLPGLARRSTTGSETESPD